MSSSIGTKIRGLRTDLQMTEVELAQKAGVKLEQIEKIESGELIPSIGVMIRISRILGTRLGTLLDGVESQEPVICTETNHTPSIHVTSPESSRASNLEFYSLAQQKSDRNMEPFIVNIGYSEPEHRVLNHHEGEEFIYVLSGSVILIYGNKSYTLHEGHSIYYDSIVPHHMSALTPDADAKILAVTYAPM